MPQLRNTISGAVVDVDDDTAANLDTSQWVPTKAAKPAAKPEAHTKAHKA